ncbi:small integral membrane protein 8 isoform X3 [Ambystoma mexicanum]
MCNFICLLLMWTLLLLGMSSTPSEPPGLKNEPPKESGYRNPGFRGVQTTSLFRAINPELFIKP